MMRLRMQKAPKLNLVQVVLIREMEGFPGAGASK